MLSIQKVSIASARYYQALAREDYYLNGGEPPGQWHGRGAETLGLGGDVGRAQFENLFRGFSPNGEMPLVQNAGKTGGQQRRVPGWDLTFSAPKSVSVLWALAPDETRAAIARAHEEAVRAALNVMEELAGYTRRGKGGAVVEKASCCSMTADSANFRNSGTQERSWCTGFAARVSSSRRAIARFGAA